VRIFLLGTAKLVRAVSAQRGASSETKTTPKITPTVGTGCLGTGPLAPECALTLFVIDVFNEGLLYGVKRYSIRDGEGKCLQ
jgi:hypothetical protein